MVEIIDQSGKTHNVDIKKVERFESDGTFLIRGKENGYNVVLHISIDPLGKVEKITHSSKDYIRLMLPFNKKTDVTNSLKSQLEGQKIVEQVINKTKQPITMYYDKDKQKLYLSRLDADSLGYIKDGELTDNDDYYELTSMQVEMVKDQYNVSVAQLTRKNNYDDLSEYIKSQVSRQYLDLQYYIDNNYTMEPEIEQIVSKVVNLNKVTSSLPEGKQKDGLMMVLYYDLLDQIRTTQGFNLSPERYKNYNYKVEAINRLLGLKESKLGIDLTVTKNILKDINNSLKACINKDGIIEPKTWFLIENFIYEIIECILLDDIKFKEVINNYNNSNLTYSQIMFELNEHLNKQVSK